MSETLPVEPIESTPHAVADEFEGRFERGVALRERTARGVLINGAFLVGIYALNLLKGVIAAAFLTTGEYGIWGVVLITVGAVLTLKTAGFSDKYVQQSEHDQERAFQKAFTLELIYSGLCMLVLIPILPLLGLAYGRSDFVVPGLVLMLVIPALALQAPIWIYYRSMQFVRQRTLQAVDPVASFVITVALAAAGLGYWSLVIGFLAGSWAGAAVAIAASPHRLALRYEGGTAREYISFSWPLLIAAVSGILIAQVSVFAGDAAVGIGAAGVVVFAASFSTYAIKLDAIVMQTLYPAICAVRDRKDLLLESFNKSNRLAILAGAPFGVGIALFAPDLVDFVLGDRWRSAVTVIQVFGLAAGASQMGFNWSAFYRASGRTRPIAIEALISLAVFLAVPVPLVFVYGLDGFAVGMGVVTLASLIVRVVFILRLFPRIRLVGNWARAAAPAVVGAAAILGARTLLGFERSLGLAIAELAAYVAIVTAATLLSERALLREMLDYLASGRMRKGALAVR
jgi:O-antigen/teichoic acid export membrane protein